MEINNLETLKLLDDYSKNYYDSRKTFFIQRSDEFRWSYTALSAVGLVLIKYIFESAIIVEPKKMILISLLTLYLFTLSLYCIRYFNLKHGFCHQVDNLLLECKQMYFVLFKQISLGNNASVDVQRLKHLQFQLKKNPLIFYGHKYKKSKKVVWEEISNKLESIRRLAESEDSSEVSKAHFKPIAFRFGLYVSEENEYLISWWKIGVLITILNYLTKYLLRITQFGFILYLIILLYAFFG